MLPVWFLSGRPPDGLPDHFLVIFIPSHLYNITASKPHNLAIRPANGHLEGFQVFSKVMHQI